MIALSPLKVNAQSAELFIKEFGKFVTIALTLLLMKEEGNYKLNKTLMNKQSIWTIVINNKKKKKTLVLVVKTAQNIFAHFLLIFMEMKENATVVTLVVMNVQ